MIFFNENSKEFHITNGKISYIFRVMEKVNTLEHLYYGKAIKHREDFSYLIEREVRPSSNLFEGDHTSSLEHVKQEYPSFGITDYRRAAFEIIYKDGDTISGFEFTSWTKYKGKKKINGLPTTFSEVDEAETLVIKLKDKYSKLTIELFYTIFKEHSVITRRAEIHNDDEISFDLNKLMSTSIDFPDSNFDFIHLNGAWARETHLQRDKLIKGIQSIGSNRGASGHIHNPFFALVRPDTSEVKGEAYGFGLVYSGNFISEIQVDSYEVTRVTMGINPELFKWRLSSGESFESPEAVLVYSDNGISGMSQIFHRFLTGHLINKKWADKERPILINNWEATYFDFDEEKILNIAKKANEVGIELLVLDDGWFGHRDSDNSSLGDWTTYKNKLPNGIRELSQKIHKIGMKFGLWFEPEMVSKDTPLFKNHSDWIIGNKDKRISHGRNQFVLDFSREEVVYDIFKQMDAILKDSQIEYVKWDMNRYISEVFSSSLPANRQGEVSHRYILGVYSLYEMLLKKYPDLLIESCAGGGGRFDMGLLYYAPQTWASDDTDAVERLKIQYGASLIYPLYSIGSHVSEVPNHQVGRNTSLKIRADVAMFGTFGYELDITKLSREELEVINNQVKEYKKHRKLIRTGNFYRILGDNHGSNEVAWMVVSQDKREALVGWYQILAKPNPPYKRLKLVGLDKDKLYKFKDGSRYGDDLMNIGLIFAGNYIDRADDYWRRDMPKDYYSKVIHLQE